MEAVEGGSPESQASQCACVTVSKGEAERDPPSPRAHQPLSSSNNYFSDVSAYFDLSLLHCPSCREPLKAPIFQCYSGHYACSSCNDSGQCATCSMPISKIRNIGLESIIETLRIRCKFLSSGCKEVLRHSEKKDHEMTCDYAPHMCPILECTFCGLLNEFIEHFTGVHKARSFKLLASQLRSISLVLGRDDMYTVLQVGGKPMFLLHNKQETIGNIVHLSSFCTPASSGIARWGYKLKVCEGSTCKLSLRSVAQSHEKLMVEAKAADFLVIPKRLFEIRIKAFATNKSIEAFKLVQLKISMQTE